MDGWMDGRDGQRTGSQVAAGGALKLFSARATQVAPSISAENWNAVAPVGWGGNLAVAAARRTTKAQGYKGTDLYRCRAIKMHSYRGVKL